MCRTNSTWAPGETPRGLKTDSSIPGVSKICCASSKPVDRWSSSSQGRRKEGAGLGLSQATTASLVTQCDSSVRSRDTALLQTSPLSYSLSTPFFSMLSAESCAHVCLCACSCVYVLVCAFNVSGMRAPKPLILCRLTSYKSLLITAHYKKFL